MLFLTFGNFVMFSIQFISEVLRYRCYWRVMQRLLPTGSIRVKSTKQASNKVHKSLLNPSESEHVEYEDDYIQISSLRPMQEVDLSSWTAYTSYLQVHSCVPDTSQNIYVLMEARRPPDLSKFVDNNLRIPPTQRVHVLSLGCPVAWKTAEPFGIILHCTFAGLVAISDAFGQNKITLDEDLELIGLATVKTQGTPQILVPPFGVISDDDLISNTIQNEPVNEQLKLNGESCYTQSVSSKQKSQLESSHITTESNLAAVSNHISDSQSEVSSSNNCQLDHTEKFLVEQTTKVNATAIKQQANQSLVSNDTQLKTESFSGESNGQDGLSGSRMKPPNILVYCGIKDSDRKFAEVKSSLEACINTEAHTIYHLKHDAVLSAPWRHNAALLLVSSCAHLRPEVEDEIRNFVLKDHGKLLSFNSSVESVFVEKVEEEGIDGERLIKFDYRDGQYITSVRGRFSYSDLKGNAQVIVPHNFCAAQNNLTEQESKQVEDTRVASSPVPNGALVVKVYCEGGGITVLSQLLLERDPTEYAKDQESFTALKNSNADRLAILRDILASLGIDTSSGTIPALTPCFLLAQRVGLKESFLESFKHRLKDNILRSQKLNLKFLPSSPTQAESTPTLLPVVTDFEYDAHTEYFNPQTYWKHLNTLTLGQVLFYTDVITSTMPVFDGLQFSIPENVGLIAVAGRQTSGRGRLGNSWLSPIGCAMFTLPLSLSLESQLGQRVSFLQHIVSVAVVQSVVTLPGYEDLDIRLKWPNDIYYGKEMKLGGVLVTSTVVDTRIYATIGCGFNVSNSNPTICINDIIRLRNISNPHLPELPPLTSSHLIARTVTCLENLIQNFEKDGHQGFCNEYYKHWLHGNCKVNIQLDKATEGVIVGLDDYGFLSVRTSDGVISVQPDGNSFDMLHNLIHVKLQS
ncbi:unnamed protein product [Candidula unifasciata]|uniref:BPL/LPL catalytic domain-containing protein n=1 Tax=Candidula unifasciata TaxID=100452 RepID=A0A8S3Z1R3_9EUPU|nr:unnamed protein product [Candidula unifasciata]